MNFIRRTHPRHARFLGVTFLALFTLFGSACHNNTPLPKYVTEFYLESPNESGIAFTMPQSHLTFHRMTDPFLDLSAVTGVESGHVTVNLPDGTTEQKACVFFFLNDDGRQRLNMATGSNQQRRIFVYFNEKPMGVRFIDQPIDSGQLFVFLEVPDKELPDYIADLKESIKRLKDLKNK